MAKKKLDFVSYTKCPNCGKEVMTRFKNEQAFCSQTCAINYRGKQRMQ